MKTRLLLTIAALMLCFGCAGTKPQRVAYISTDAIGQAVDDAMKAYSAYKLAEAKTALGPNATGMQAADWVRAQSDWQKASKLHYKYQCAYLAWCEANAAVATSTNVPGVLASPTFRQDLLTTAGDLIAFIAQFVPSVKPLPAQ